MEKKCRNLSILWYENAELAIIDEYFSIFCQIYFNLVVHLIIKVFIGRSFSYQYLHRAFILFSKVHFTLKFVLRVHFIVKICINGSFYSEFCIRSSFVYQNMNRMIIFLSNLSKNFIYWYWKFVFLRAHFIVRICIKNSFSCKFDGKSNCKYKCRSFSNFW